MEDDEWEYLEKKTTEFIRAPSLEELCSTKDRATKKAVIKADRLGKEFIDLTNAVKGAKKRLNDLRVEVLDSVPEHTKNMLKDKDTPPGEYAVTVGEHLYTFKKKDSLRIILNVKRLKPL